MSAGVQMSPQPPQPTPAEIGPRILAFLIDIVPIFIVSMLLGWIPIAGIIIVGLIGLAYWLLRDIVGASIGKKLLGMQVFMKDNSPAPSAKCILRNITIAAPYLFMMIPLAGYILGPVVAVIAFVTELIMLLAKKERLGDMLANTTVMKIK